MLIFKIKNKKQKTSYIYAQMVQNKHFNSEKKRNANIEKKDKAKANLKYINSMLSPVTIWWHSSR